MKFHHEFVLVDQKDSTYLFASGSLRARLDFLEETIRVAIYEEGAYLFPPFSICPVGQMPEEGREKSERRGGYGETE